MKTEKTFKVGFSLMVAGVCLLFSAFSAFAANPSRFSDTYLSGLYFSAVASQPNGAHDAVGAKVIVNNIKKGDGSSSEYNNVIMKVNDCAAITVSKGTETSLPYADDPNHNEMILDGKGANPILDCRVSGTYSAIR